MICTNCGNKHAYHVINIREDGKMTEKCDQCGAKSTPVLSRDYTEKALRMGIAPGKFRDRCIESHRKEVHENLKTMPKVVKTNNQLIKEV